MSRGHEVGSCAEAREAVHESLDSGLMDATSRQRLEDHLGRCEACRELADELRAIQGGLRDLPDLKLPDEVLERVWVRTTRAGGRRTRGWRWNLAAAAALVAIVLSGLWLRNGSAPTGPTDAELTRAAREARLVLQLTSRALRRTERAAVQEVLTDEVSHALRRVPISWPERGATPRSGS